MSSQETSTAWKQATTTDELAKAGKLVVDLDGTEMLLLWNDGEPTAMDNICIHRGRGLVQGFLLNGRIVCPGHQWAFDVNTGFCREREQSQPTFPTRVTDNVVEVQTPDG
jgi:nitrite reductase (NADH) small subunit